MVDQNIGIEDLNDGPISAQRLSLDVGQLDGGVGELKELTNYSADGVGVQGGR